MSVQTLEVPKRVRKPVFYKGLLVAANVRVEDGIPKFGAVDSAWVEEEAWPKRLCQLCGTKIAKTDWCVFPGSFGLTYYTEAPLHVECARYSLQVCPFIIGKKDTFGVSLCKKYNFRLCQAPIWDDPYAFPELGAYTGNQELQLSLAHKFYKNDEGKYKCHTCTGNYIGQQSYAEFLNWSR